MCCCPFGWQLHLPYVCLESKRSFQMLEFGFCDNSSKALRRHTARPGPVLSKVNSDLRRSQLFLREICHKQSEKTCAWNMFGEMLGHQKLLEERLPKKKLSLWWADEPFKSPDSPGSLSKAFCDNLLKQFQLYDKLHVLQVLASERWFWFKSLVFEAVSRLKGYCLSSTTQRTRNPKNQSQDSPESLIALSAPGVSLNSMWHNGALGLLLSLWSSIFYKQEDQQSDKSD